MSVYKNWILGSRPWSFSMTAISVSVGGMLAAQDGEIAWGLFFLTLCSAVLMHAGTNLINDYYDVKSGVDTVKAATAQYRPHPLVAGLLPPEQVRWAAYGLFATAACIGLFLAAVSGWMVLWIGLIGLAAGIAYTAPPLKYKYFALGEMSVFLMWGPLMVEGAYYVQRQTLSLKAFYISLPFGVLVALVLLANNIRDIEHDRSRGIKTLAILLGRRLGLWAYLLFMVAAYAGILVMIRYGVITLWALLIFITVPLAFRLLHQMVTVLPKDADAQTAKLDTAFGGLLVLSLLLEGFLG